MGQLMIIDEDKYDELRFKARWYDLINKDIDFFANKFYPEIEYWTDTGRSIDVAYLKLKTMADEIERRRPFWHRPKIEV